MTPIYRKQLTFHSMGQLLYDRLDPRPYQGGSSAKEVKEYHKRWMARSLDQNERRVSSMDFGNFDWHNRGIGRLAR